MLLPCKHETKEGRFVAPAQYEVLVVKNRPNIVAKLVVLFRFWKSQNYIVLALYFTI